MEERKKVMSDDAREARNAYYRKWRRENKDKVKEYRAKHWEKVAERARSGQ